jgi:flagellar motor switch/type III secretory pathway protein FliN
MDDAFRTKGTLTVSLGEGYLSAFEVSTLKPGDVVKTSRTAGTPYAVLYNGLPLAQCEAVILGAKGGGSVWGFRVCDTDFPATFACGPIRKEEVGELLPFVVVLGSARFSLAELEGVGLHTLVSLGTSWNMEEDAELVVAGFPVARGKVVAIREDMGLRVTRLLAKSSPVALVASSGFFLDQASAALLKIKDYDFRRPDKFSYEQILGLRDIHGLVLRNLRARLPCLGELIQAGPYPDVDQCTLGEAAADLAARGLGDRTVLENRPWRTAVPGRELPARPARLRSVVEEEGNPHPVDPKVRVLADQYLEANGLAGRNAVYLHHGEEPQMRRILESEADRNALIECLRGGWRNVVDLNLRVAPAEEAASASPISPDEMVVLVTFGSRAGTGPLLAVVYPYLTLEPFLRLLGR